MDALNKKTIEDMMLTVKEFLLAVTSMFRLKMVKSPMIREL